MVFDKSRQVCLGNAEPVSTRVKSLSCEIKLSRMKYLKIPHKYVSVGSGYCKALVILSVKIKVNDLTLSGGRNETKCVATLRGKVIMRLMMIMRNDTCNIMKRLFIAKNEQRKFRSVNK